MKQKTLEQIQEERRERRKQKAIEAEFERNAEKNSYHQQINEEMRKRFSPSDEIAILRHAVVILADALIQGGVLTKEDLNELLAWNEKATKAKEAAKAMQKKEKENE